MDKHLFRIFVTAALLAAAFLPAQARAAEDKPAPQAGPVAVATPEALTNPGHQSFDPGVAVTPGAPVTGSVDGRDYKVRPEQGLHSGYFLPDGRGGYVWAGSAEPMAPPKAEHEQAREIKLKVRELADQLLDGRPNQDLAGAIAMPLSFVSQDDFQQTSSFGRYLAEQMFHEFNQRGIAVREYRMDDMLSTRQGEGEFLLSRRQQQMEANYPGGVLLLGTYYHDKYNVFVNARLVRPADGLVLRTALLVFGLTDVTRHMLAGRSRVLESTYVSMKDFTTMTRDASITSIDLGEDTH
jgi:hypothetical protein